MKINTVWDLFVSLESFDMLNRDILLGKLYHYDVRGVSSDLIRPTYRRYDGTITFI